MAHPADAGLGIHARLAHRRRASAKVPGDAPGDRDDAHVAQGRRGATPTANPRHADAGLGQDLGFPVPEGGAGLRARQAGSVHVADSLDELTRTWSQGTRRLLPKDPFLVVGQQSMTAPTRQPPGKETAWASTHVTQRPVGDAGGELHGLRTAGEVEAFAGRREARVERWAPGFRAIVRGRHVTGPHDSKRQVGNLPGGALNGGTAEPHQQLLFRPVPGLGRAETPIEGLHLASASAHPGGRVHGGPGSNTARAALHRHLGRRIVLPLARRVRSSPV